ncbi:MAG: EamA family transporter [Gammaproteobacteria bacterium]|nr:EamA family transporter [Gammaproteobacteria bacterium]MBP6051297.1 EamA family transporter [Pseudomonadales bacterium]MBK6581643.1 EamA family transporter [Gammaproteobacteria bacterium]MBK7170493.1 EamA family transporter [Gammaproteobacteria bacterium]MBK7522403.1 EamA family transporter [Gammaproteobacteria bacterium]
MIRSSSRSWRLGLALSLTTAVLWGAVPLAMVPLVAAVDAVTISWFRFVGSGLMLLALIAASGNLRRPRRIAPVAWWLFGLAVLTLVGNYVLYVSSLRYIGAPVAQTVVQLAPVLLMLGSLWLFGERFTWLQWTGFMVLVTGIVGFCAERLRLTGSGVDVFGTGVLLMVLAALLWAVYGLAQKRLLHFLPSQIVLLGIYLAGGMVMLPAASPRDLLHLDTVQVALLVFLALNTLIAYGAFAEALNHWDSSKVSAVLAVQPLTTLFGAHLLGVWLPLQFPQTTLTPAVLFASLVVVVGSVFCALGGQLGARPPRGPDRSSGSD